MAIDLSSEIYRLAKQFPPEETYALRNQIQRAVVSIASNIAKGYAREKLKEEIYFIDVARGSLNEVYCQLAIAFKLNYINNSQLKQTKDLILNLQHAINGYKNIFPQKNNNTFPYFLFPFS